jgi:beta-glucosidase
VKENALVDVERLALEVKAGLTSGLDTWHTKPAPDLPSLRLADGPHGLRRQPESVDNLGFSGSLPATCFPPAVGLAASWNPGLVERVGSALGVEARSFGVHVLLGPGMNIKRSPLCGRNFEYFSEDPLLTGRMAAAMVRGIQSQAVAATPKHFAVNNQETDRMRVNAEVSDRALREIYLSAFEHVVRHAQPWALMTAYNRVNGIYASEHPWLLHELLREQWGFDGLVMSDWGAVDDRVAALRAGLDLEMPPSDSDHQVVSAVEEGVLDGACVDRSAQRLRRLATRVLPAQQGETFDAAAHHALAAEAAAECIVLLKNEDDALPLRRHGTVAVIGGLARRPRLQGGGSSRVNPAVHCDPVEELRRAAGPEVRLVLADGYQDDERSEEEGTDAALLAEAVRTVREADVAVLFLGLPESWESEGFDRTHLDLPPAQVELVHALAETGTPLVAVLANGGVVSVSSWHDRVDALLETWLLGQAGPAAVADVLFGHTSPSGRLAETIPYRLQDGPSYLHFPGEGGTVRYGEDVYVGYRWYESVEIPVAYPFGHGLTYSDFAYGGLVCTRLGHNSWHVQAEVTNVGSRTAAETVQLYVQPEQQAPKRPARELRGFRKVTLKPGESSQVAFDVSERDLALWSSEHGGWHVPAGNYQLLVAASVRDVRLAATVAAPGNDRGRELLASSTLGEWLSDPVGRTVLAPLVGSLETALGGRVEGLLQIAQHVPLKKMVDHKMGLTHERVAAFVAAAARERYAQPAVTSDVLVAP